MKSDIENECYYSNVPDYVTRFWADEKGKVKYFFKDLGDEVNETDYENLFLEEVEIYDGAKDTDEVDEYLRSGMKESLESLANGDQSDLNRNNLSLYYYVSAQFNVNYYSIGRYRLVLGENADLLRKYAGTKKLGQLITSLLASVRHTEEIEMESIRAREDMPLLLDLKPILIEAAPQTAFVLPECPLLFMNLLKPSNTSEPVGAEDFYGTLFITPLSPRYALCLYDSYTYKIRKEGETAAFTYDDMLLVNSLLFKSSPKVAFIESEKFPSSLLLSLREDGKSKSNENELSLFLIRNRSLEREDDVRDYVREFLDHDDEEHYSDYYGSMSEKAISERIDYALSLLS